MGDFLLHPFDPKLNKPRRNADGSVSTEITRTVQTPDGWMNVPSLWWGDGENVRDFGSMSDDQIADVAGRYEKQSGKSFPRFADLQAAESAAKQRSAAGGGNQGAITTERPMAFDFMKMFGGGTPNMLTQPPQADNMLTGFQKFSQSPFGRNLQNAMLGWAQGGTVQDSLGKGAQMVALGRKEREGDQQRNQTVEWLKTKGMDDNQARAIASNPAVLTDVLKTMLDPNAALDTEYKRAQIENIQSQVAERNNPDARKRFGLNPQYGIDANGNPVLLQLGEDGSAQQTQMPEGVSLAKEPIKLDAGTHFVLLDPITRQPVGQIEKDLAGAERDKKLGEKRGDAEFDLPRVEQNAAQTLGVLERMKTHPGREGSTGFIQGVLPSRTSDQVDFQSLVDQTQGQSFLQAFQMLKGAGQITEIEGTKATDAISRLRNQRLSDADYLKAITDLEEVIKAGLDRAKVQAGQGTQKPAGTDYKSKYGLN